MKYTKLFIPIVLLLLLALLLGGGKEPAPKYIGQTCPPDMEFIPGNDKLPAFFMGKSEETNMDYLLYLNWLEHVFGKDRPDYIRLFEPRALEDSAVRLNDPVATNYFRNPAFAYYPVTGLDWLQVQEYLEWKTDRLNESILAQTGILQYKPYEELMENNFNTEAYLTCQTTNLTLNKTKMLRYEEEEMINLSPNKSRSIFADKNPFLFTQYRLPTEEEWEYAAGEQFANKQLLNNKTPFGKEFFLLKYANMAKIPDENYWLSNYVKSIEPNQPAQAAGLHGASSYDNSKPGIYNMGNNVREWLMDTYTDQMKHYANLSDIYFLNGFPLCPDAKLKDKNGIFQSKIFNGELPCKHAGILANGNDLWVENFPESRGYDYAIKRIPNVDSVNCKKRIKRRLEMERIAKSVEYLNYQKTREQFNIQRYEYYKNGKNLIEIKQDAWSQYNQDYYYEKRVGYLPSPKDTVRYAITDSMVNIHRGEWDNWQSVFMNGNPLYKKEIQQRVVKGGNWRQPSTTARISQPENKGAADIGFRVVLQYTGMPIAGKYRVRWPR